MQLGNKPEDERESRLNRISRRAKNSIIVSAALAFGALAIPSDLFAQDGASKGPVNDKPAMRMGRKVIKERTFFGEMMEKEREKERMINAVLNSRNVTAYSASRFMKRIESPEEDRQKFEKIIGALAGMEADEEIRTSIYTAFAETDEEAAEEMERKENIEHAITITWYPTEKALIIQFLTDLKAGESQFEKGTCIIYDEEGMKIEKPESNKNENGNKSN